MELLNNRGIESKILPGFISNPANIVPSNPQKNLLQTNKRLHFLGGNGFELDYYVSPIFIKDSYQGGIKWNTLFSL